MNQNDGWGLTDSWLVMRMRFLLCAVVLIVEVIVAFPLLYTNHDPSRSVIVLGGEIQTDSIQTLAAPTLYYSAYTSSRISSRLLSIKNYLPSSSRTFHLHSPPTHQLHQHHPSIPSTITKPNLLVSPPCPSHPTEISPYPRAQMSSSQAPSSGSSRDCFTPDPP